MAFLEPGERISDGGVLARGLGEAAHSGFGDTEILVLLAVLRLGGLGT